jgi:GGDEF domain-containing protein
MEAMQAFDRVDPNTLDGRELQLSILAPTVIIVLAIGVGLLMYPAVFSHPSNLSEIPTRAVFFGFCALAAMMVDYFVDREAVIRRLRAELEKERRQTAKVRREASADLLSTLPGLNCFCDLLAMEFRRASGTQQHLSLLAVELKPSSTCTEPGEVETAFGDAAKTLLRTLRCEDSIFLLEPGFFGIVLPAVNARDAYALRDRLMEGLHDAAGASNRFSFDISVFSFPEHVSSAREMEESVRSLIPPQHQQAFELGDCETREGLRRSLGFLRAGDPEK